jgi:hypothetical protein
MKNPTAFNCLKRVRRRIRSALRPSTLSRRICSMRQSSRRQVQSSTWRACYAALPKPPNFLGMANTQFVGALACCRLLAKLPPGETQLIQVLRAALNKHLRKALEATVSFREIKGTAKLDLTNYLRCVDVVVNCVKVSRALKQIAQSQTFLAPEAAKPASPTTCLSITAPNRPADSIPNLVPFVRPSLEEVPQPLAAGQ